MKFHDELNPIIWDKDNDNQMRPEVIAKLKEIANAFIEYLEIPEDAVLDMVVTGSSASYNYNKYSDLDLHIIVDYDKIHEDCPLVEGYLGALKNTFNKEHDIFIKDVPVELYAEKKDQGTVHNGLYSVQEEEWIDRPKKIPPTDNDAAVEAKFNEIKEMVDKCDDSEAATELLEKIYSMRKAGLATAGEFCTENLAFKKLRNEGCMDKLREIKKKDIDKQLSLESYNEAFNTLDLYIDGQYYDTFNNEGEINKYLDDNNIDPEYSKVEIEETPESKPSKHKYKIGDKLIIDGLVTRNIDYTGPTKVTIICYYDDDEVYEVETDKGDTGYINGSQIISKNESIKESKSYNEEVVTKTQNGVTWTGFDTENNDKIWVESEGIYTYVKYQPNETQIESVCIQEVNKDNYKERQPYHTNIPIKALKQPMYTFWLGKDYWMDNLQDAIDFIYKHFEHERNKNESIKESVQNLTVLTNEDKEYLTKRFSKMYKEDVVPTLINEVQHLLEVCDWYKSKEFIPMKVNGFLFNNKIEWEPCTIEEVQNDVGRKNLLVYLDRVSPGRDSLSTKTLKSRKNFIGSNSIEYKIEFKKDYKSIFRGNTGMNEDYIIDRFKEMANKIAADFKAEGYPKSNKYLLDFVNEAVKKFSTENKGYLLRTSTDNGEAVITLCNMNGEEDGSIYQARINGYGKCKVKFTDLENSNYAYESLEEKYNDGNPDSIIYNKLTQYMMELGDPADILPEDCTIDDIITWIFEHNKEAYTKSFWIDTFKMTEKDLDKYHISDDLDESLNEGKKREVLSNDEYAKFILAYMSNDPTYEEVLNMLPMINDDLYLEEIKTIKRPKLKAIYNRAVELKKQGITESVNEEIGYYVIDKNGGMEGKFETKSEANAWKRHYNKYNNLDIKNDYILITTTQLNKLEEIGIKDPKEIFKKFKKQNESIKEGLDKIVNKAMNEEDLKAIWKNEMKREPIIDTPDGPIYLQPSEDGKSIEYGTMTNTGMLVDGSVEYDFDYSLDANLDAVYDEITDTYGLNIVPEEDRDLVCTQEKEDKLNSSFIEAAEGIYDPRTILKAYNIEKAWIEKMEHTVGGVTQVLLFIINHYKQILDTHAVNKKDIYTYEPKENEYYLDRTRDTGDVITDYNLEPAQKLVDRWNEGKEWSNMLKEELEPVYHYSVEDIDQRGDDFDNAEEAYEQAKEQLSKLGYEVKELNDDGEFKVLSTSTGVAYTGVIYPSNPELDEDVTTLTDKVDQADSDLRDIIDTISSSDLRESLDAVVKKASQGLNEDLDEPIEDEFEQIRDVLDTYADSENAFIDGFVTFEDLRQFDANNWLKDWSNDVIRDVALEMGYEVDGDKILDPSL